MPIMNTSDGFAISQADRDKAAKSGAAMPDGSYPIFACEGDNSVDSAVPAVGRGTGNHDSIRKHIMKRAKSLGCASKIPDNWNADGSLQASADPVVAAARSIILDAWYSALAAGEDPLVAAAPVPPPPAPKPPGAGAPAGDAPYKPEPYHVDPDETVKCPNCGKMNDTDATYCDQCGFKLAGSNGVVVGPPESDEAPPAAAGASAAPGALAAPPPPPAPAGGSKAPSGPVPNEVKCANTASDGTMCAHFASAHADTEAGANTGACQMANCGCTGMKVPDASPVAASSESEAFALPPSLDPTGPPAASEAEPPPLPVVPPAGLVGAAFKIPVAIIEGLQTSDGRTIVPGALTARPTPLPLMWLSTSSHGPDSEAGPAQLVGRIDSITKDGNNWTASGNLLAGYPGEQLVEILAQFGTLGISADLADVSSEITIPLPEEGIDFDPMEAMFGPTLESITAGEIMGLTVCPFPAFAGCYIMLDDGSEPPAVPIAQPTSEGAAMGINIVSTLDCAPCRSAAPLMASGGPGKPPRAWFEVPEPDGLMALTVTDEGQVFGHLAPWNVPHIGRSGRIIAPKSVSDYAYFHTGYTVSAEGDIIPVGRITSRGGHANNWASPSAAMAHYDNTDWWAASVVASNGKHGVWVCGAMKPGATDDQFATMRACPPSGDWRPIAGRPSPELVGAACVNVPGFPTVRPKAVYASGQLVSLIAAGVVIESEAPASMERRVALLEGAIMPLLPSVKATLTARFHSRRAGRRPLARLAAGDADALIKWYNDGADGQINWGSPGDFEDCVALAKDHLDNPEGFCQERHMDATGEPAGKGDSG